MTRFPGRTFERAAVLGGAGFVGSHLCDALVATGTEVVCVDNLSTGRRANVSPLAASGRFRMIEHDVVEPLPDLGPVDVVFGLASAASPIAYGQRPLQTLRAGSAGTDHALQLAERHQARFVLASTSEVYGDPEVHPQTEDYVGHVNPIGPRSVYDEAKRYAEALTAAYVRTGRVDAGIARIFNTYGPRMQPDDGRLVPTFVTQALSGEPCTISGSGTQTRSLCHVTDTVYGLLLLAGSSEAGPVNIGNPQERTVAEIARIITTLAGLDAEPVRVAAVPDDPHRRCPDISRARQTLQWEPRVDLEDGLRQTLAWFAAQQRTGAAV